MARLVVVVACLGGAVWLRSRTPQGAMRQQKFAFSWRIRKSNRGLSWLSKVHRHGTTACILVTPIPEQNILDCITTLHMCALSSTKPGDAPGEIVSRLRSVLHEDYHDERR